jgi:hypothetical protein|tara:strand:- start:352 stop:627 length:276 start_codon:yes stop_codon:yes gene_type:complete
MANLELRQENPPAKLHTENRGSKYDVAINTALENTGTWYRVASTTVENRDSMYSTASALRGGRLGNVPADKSIEVMVRRVDDEIVLFIKGL